MIELKNLIVLGQGAPNQLNDGRYARCVCGYSKEYGYVRIYPIPQQLLRLWDIFDIVVEKNPQDHRKNSLKVKNSKKDWKILNKWIKVKGFFRAEDRYDLIKSLATDNLGNLIKSRESFGIIKPRIKRFDLEQQREKTEAQTTLLDLDFHIIDQKDYKYKPYVSYECEPECDCKNKTHKQQIVEWGCYEWMRKNPSNEVKCFDNLRLTDNDYDKFFLVGNLFRHPKTYVIVNIFRFKK